MGRPHCCALSLTLTLTLALALTLTLTLTLALTLTLTLTLALALTLTLTRAAAHSYPTPRRPGSLRPGPTGASRALASAAHLSSYDGRRCLGLRSWHMTRRRAPSTWTGVGCRARHAYAAVGPQDLGGAGSCGVTHTRISP